MRNRTPHPQQMQSNLFVRSCHGAATATRSLRDITVVDRPAQDKNLDETSVHVAPFRWTSAIPPFDGFQLRQASRRWALCHCTWQRSSRRWRLGAWRATIAPSHPVSPFVLPFIPHTRRASCNCLLLVSNMTCYLEITSAIAMNRILACRLEHERMSARTSFVLPITSLSTSPFTFDVISSEFSHA